MSSKAPTSAIKSHWEVGLHLKERLALGDPEQSPAEAHTQQWLPTAPRPGGESKAELPREEQAETSGAFPWSAGSCAWGGGRVGEEEGVPCTEQHPAPLGTLSRSTRGVSSHPGGAAGEKTLRTKAHEPDFGATVRMPVRDSAEQSREPSKRVPGEQAGAVRRAPTPARNRRQSGTLQHAVMSFRSLCTCKHGWCGAAGTLHFLLTARLHLAGFLPEKVRLLLSSLCDLEPTLTSLCRFLRKRCAPQAFS